MSEWKLPSQLIITDRKENESDYEMFHRHESMRRITAESDLIKALDLIEGLKILYSKNEAQNEVMEKFLSRFLDKTINN